MNDSDSILQEYEKKKLQYKAVGEEVKRLLEKNLKKSKLKFLPILERLKEKKSLEKKILNPKYKLLSDLTDIYGIRVIVFQNSDIDKVSNIIKSIFKYDEPNSEDKRFRSPTEFGYNSVHSIVSLLPNHALKSDCKIEIQVRTVLQHAWSEFSHELGYKNTNNVPTEFLRDINRISALLEVGDKEFERLRIENSKYISKIDKDLKEGVRVEINQPSLRSILSNNEYLNRLTMGVTNDFGIKFRDVNGNFTEIIDRFTLLGFNDIILLEDYLADNHEHFFRFVKLFFERRLKFDKVSVLAKNAALFYLCHYIAASKGREFFENVYHSFSKYKIITPINLYDIYEETI